VWLQTKSGYWIYWPLTYTTLNYNLQITDTHRIISSVYYSLHSQFPGNGFYREKFFSFPNSGPLVEAALAELLSTDNSTNWFPGWRPFHTSLLFFSSQADFQLTTDNWQLNSRAHKPATSHHFIQLNCWQLQPTINSLFQSLLFITSRHEPRKNIVFIITI
jgi:hypothetical protein